MDQDKNFIIPNVSYHNSMIWDGALTESHFDNPFLRWHKSFENYPSFLTDMDDYCMHETDDFERFKKYKAKPKDVVGVTPIIQASDNDELFNFYDV